MRSHAPAFMCDFASTDCGIGGEPIRPVQDRDRREADRRDGHAECEQRARTPEELEHAHADEEDALRDERCTRARRTPAHATRPAKTRLDAASASSAKSGASIPPTLMRASSGNAARGARRSSRRAAAGRTRARSARPLRRRRARSSRATRRRGRTAGARARRGRSRRAASSAPSTGSHAAPGLKTIPRPSVRSRVAVRDEGVVVDRARAHREEPTHEHAREQERELEAREALAHARGPLGRHGARAHRVVPVRTHALP